MVAGNRETHNWRDEVRQHLAALHASLASPELVSEVPRYLIEILSTQIENVMSSRIEPDTVHAMLRGAYRAIYDVANPDDDDVVVKQLQTIDDSLPHQQ